MRNNCFIYLLSAIIVLVLGSERCLAESYTTLKLPRVNDGQMVYLIDFDTEAVIDSIPVSNEAVVFKSDQYKPSLINVVVEDTNYGIFVLNDSQITHDVKVENIEGGVRRTWNAYGGYNDSISAIARQCTEISQKLMNSQNVQTRDSINNEIKNLLFDKICDNADNVLGYRLFLMSESLFSLADVENLLDRYPSLNNYKKINVALNQKKALNETKTGNKFKDFTISFEGIQHRLSDVVGKGDYILVDFWAFWCAPCRAEMPYIKDVFNKYKDKNFKVLGIAISDSPEKDLQTAAELELPWEVWVNGYDASKVYSIRSIPHLILFGPDGTILERGIRGENILPAISKYLDADK